jgi:hypothetical protein
VALHLSYLPGVDAILKPDRAFPRGVSVLDSKADVPLPMLVPPTLLHKRCPAGVNWPEPTLGLLGNLGTGVMSALPVSPYFVEARFVFAFLSTIR